jgi:hypothetical protein
LPSLCEEFVSSLALQKEKKKEGRGREGREGKKKEGRNKERKEGRKE